MAFPLTTHTTFTWGTVTTPDYFNDYETYIVGLYAATRSLKSMYIDGTGGAAVTPAKGRLYVNGGTAWSTTQGVDVTITKNGGFGDNASFAAGAGGMIDARGSIVVTCSAPNVGANPSIAVVYKDATWTTTPIPYILMTSSTDAGALTRSTWISTYSATGFTAVFKHTPVDTNTYEFHYWIVG